jgi:hypothetical protein
LYSISKQTENKFIDLSDSEKPTLYIVKRCLQKWSKASYERIHTSPKFGPRLSVIKRAGWGVILVLQKLFTTRMTRLRILYTYTDQPLSNANASGHTVGTTSTKAPKNSTAHECIGQIVPANRPMPVSYCAEACM